MSFLRTHNIAAATTAFVITIIASFGTLGPSLAAPDAKPGYRFELVGQPVKTGPGVSVVSVRLVHLSDKKPVPKAVIFETRADMGPEGMAAMTAPVKALPESNPGTYPFEITFGPVWNRPGGWALTLAAKVQGERETVRGNVTVTLEP